jgi:hypothetical protein
MSAGDGPLLPFAGDDNVPACPPVWFEAGAAGLEAGATGLVSTVDGFCSSG